MYRSTTPKQATPLRQLLLSSMFSLLTIAAIGQTAPNSTEKDVFAPGGYLNTVFDNTGKQFTLGEIAINDEIRASSTRYAERSTASSCSSGYFQMHLQPGCGMDGSDATSIARLNVLCQVLKDISQFISSPLTTTGNKVHIWVRNSGASGGAAGVATPFYNIPNATPTGIADNAIWITINSGKDAFTNVASPLSTSGGGSSGSTFFHGSIAFNFTGSINWHTDLSTPTPAGKWDLYTVALHEMLHAMGFNSLINYDGTSVFGSGYNYYSRYDLNLQTAAGIPLITNSGSCNLYQYNFNSALTPFAALCPGATSSTCPSGYNSGASVDHTVCINAIKYVNGTLSQPVYTPSCFEKGSSLSHFEDQCAVPATFSSTHTSLPSFNNQYFVMSNAGAAGPYTDAANPAAMKRAMTPEERQVLCNMGYIVGNTYGSTTNLNFANYTGGTCAGLGVAGINDGITSGGAFSFITSGTAPVDINTGSAGSILANDYGAVSFKCLEVVIGNGTVSASTGTSSTLVYFTPLSGAHGVQLLRYVPVNAAGESGNITYVYVYVGDLSCVPGACNIVSNGNFESVGTSSIPLFNGVHCWSTYSGSNDAFQRGSSHLSFSIPTSAFFADGSEVHPFSTGTNDYYIGGMSGRDLSAGDFYAENCQTWLSTPVVTGNTYFLSFWARFSDNMGSPMLPNKVLFAVSPAAPLVAVPYHCTSTPPGLSTLGDFTVICPDNKWHYYSQVVTYTGPTANSLVVLAAPWLNPTSGPYATAYFAYMVFDDVVVRPAASICTFNLPDTMCLTSGLRDLTRDVTVGGGTFSWVNEIAGVVDTTHDTMFDPVKAYNASILRAGTGYVQICYSYTDAMGCPNTVCAETHILNMSAPPIIGDTVICQGMSTTLSNVTGGGIWTSNYVPVATIGSTSGVVTGTTSGTSTIDYILPTGCYNTIKMTIDGTSPIDGITTITIGTTSTLSHTSTGGTWTSANLTVATVGSATGIVRGLTVGTAIMSYVTPGGCIITTTVTVKKQTGLQTNASGLQGIHLMPNPSKGVLSVSGYLGAAHTHTDVAIEVTDLLGNVCQREKSTTDNGDLKTTIRLNSNLADGVYFLRIISSGESTLIRFVLNR